ncbi:MAG: cation-translocating P-type ATPase [Bacteroidia bacterium]|nr:cation-translocating P-type ATPase [Bacteroidia bacterium]
MEWHRQPADQILELLNSSLKGLSKEEAARRAAQYGINELEASSNWSPVRLFINQFRSFIIYILLFAVLLSALLKEYADAVIILCILLVNALIGFFQELGARRSLDALRRMQVVRTRVYRDASLVLLDSRELVPGDIVYLEAGDKVPADLRILQAARLRSDESALTGESLPAEKNSCTLDRELPLADRSNMLFSGTTIVNGTATAAVVLTGMQTEIGHISRMMSEAEETATPLQERLDRFGKGMGYLVMAICGVIFMVIGGKEYLANGWNQDALLSVFMIAVSLAVAAVPEGLPSVVTIALSIGVKKLLKRKALVRKLAAVETLGSCDVICSDKTGTLTRNEMTVVQAWTPAGELRLSGTGYELEGSVTGEFEPLLFDIGRSCNHATVQDGKVSGDPTEIALIVSAWKAGLREAAPALLDEIPFDSDRKMMSVRIRKGDSEWMYVKGAPDQLLLRCTRLRNGGSEQPLESAQRQQILDQASAYSAQALRVIACACKPLDETHDFTEEELTFTGLQAMIDPPREEVPEAVRKTREAGIRVIMITGDHADTARAVGAQVGITGGVMTGAALQDLSQEELTAALDQGVNIFARVSPEHKLRIISALQAQHHTVAMTGDGVNDAPALKQADIGVAVGSGTDVARDAADLVLLDDSFATIVNSVEEGRGIYNNIQKSILLLLSGNMAEVLMIFLAALFGLPLPLTAILLLWVNLVTDGAPALALSVDPYSKRVMQQPPRSRKIPLLPRTELTLIVALGLLTAVAGLILFQQAAAGNLLVHGRTMAFTFIVLAEMVILLVIRAFHRTPVWTNRWVWIAIAGCLGLQLLLLYTPLQTVFELHPLSLYDWGLQGLALTAFGLIAWGLEWLLRRQKLD